GNAEGDQGRTGARENGADPAVAPVGQPGAPGGVGEGAEDGGRGLSKSCAGAFHFAAVLARFPPGPARGEITMPTIAESGAVSRTRPDLLSGTPRAHAIDRWIYVSTAASFIAIVLAGFIPRSLSKIAAMQAGQRPPF